MPMREGWTGQCVLLRAASAAAGAVLTGIIIYRRFGQDAASLAGHEGRPANSSDTPLGAPPAPLGAPGPAVSSSPPARTPLPATPAPRQGAQVERADIAPGTEFCRGLPGWVSVDIATPIRSPLAVVDVLRPHVAGKRVCEVGTRKGDILWCLARAGATSAHGYEMEAGYCMELERRGLGVTCGNFLQRTTAELAAKCDFYYCFPEDPQVATCFLSLIRRAVWEAKMPAVTVVIAYDTRGTSAAIFLERDMKRYAGYRTEVTFNETADYKTGWHANKLPAWIGKHAVDLVSRTQSTISLVWYNLSAAGPSAEQQAAEDKAALSAPLCADAAVMTLSNFFSSEKRRGKQVWIPPGKFKGRKGMAAHLNRRKR
eukprot:TRINITY_DN18492_c0_g1_i2.p1 TRINITY_DN18492_c0_g1~~TRINITY_DN18492_c0_g1_i2.p1  ORF type:complete len:371 (+),score=66.27 TRINITY_DN18492_c0_g1_i2:103-1215(+)